MTIYFPKEWTKTYAQGLNTEEYCELSFKNLKEDPSIQNFKHDTTTINNYDYITDEYSMTNGTFTINLYQLCIVVDDISYIITLGSSPENIEANKKIINNLAKDFLVIELAIFNPYHYKK